MNKLAIIAGLSLASFVVAPADLLFSQLPNDADGYFSDGISTNGSQYWAQAMADNFTLAQQSDITTIRFWGSSENFVFDDLSNFSAWDIYFYDSSFNVLAWDQIAKAGFTITPTGNNNSGGGIEYMFELATSGLSLNAGDYRMHIGSINNAPGDDGWIWSLAAGDGQLYGNLFDGNGWGTAADDLAFELEGNPVPEPASMAAFGLGLAALAARRRRKSA
jgi:hypothetical protein